MWMTEKWRVTKVKGFEKVNYTLVPWTIFKTPSGKPASIANAARIIEVPEEKRKGKNNINRINVTQMSLMDN